MFPPRFAIYALIALGRQIKVIQDSTRDPATVLAAIASKNFIGAITDTEALKLIHDIQEFTIFMHDVYCEMCLPCIQNARSPGYPDGNFTLFLAYVPKNKLEDGTFRHIAVEVSNKKLHVNAKAGYWAPKR